MQARVSLRAVLVAIAILAAGLAAVVSQSRTAASLAFTVFWVANLIAVAGAIVTRSRLRAFCVGFAVFGLGYWLIAFEIDSADVTNGNPWVWFRGRILYRRIGDDAHRESDRFITSQLVDLIESSVRPSLAPGAQVNAQFNGGAYYTGKVGSFDGTNYVIVWDDGTAPSPVPPAGIRGWTQHVRTSAHSMIGLLFALIGGVATRASFDRSVGSPVRRSLPQAEAEHP
jgi:hypothetical protein